MKKYIFLVFMVVVIFYNKASTQWQKDGVAIVDTSRNVGQWLLHQIVEDGDGGAIICWRDLRGWDSYDVFAQRIDKNGYIKWQRNGVPISRAILNQDYPMMTSDGYGGAIIGWEDVRDTIHTNIFVQKIDKDGKLIWENDGVRVSQEHGMWVRLLKDGNGGAIIVWEKLTPSYISTIFAQRISKDGKRMWGDTGVVIDGRPQGMMPNGDVEIIPDGMGGAFVFWSKNKKIYGQRIDTSGNWYWEKDGKELGIGNIISTRIHAVNDNNFGAVFTWYDDSLHFRVQRVDSNGNKLWSDSGNIVASHPFIYSDHGGDRRLISDKEGGAFVGIDWKIYRLNGRGVFLWNQRGILFADDSLLMSGESSAMIDDMEGGLINIADLLFYKLGPYVNQRQSNLYAQKIDKEGNRKWGKLGIHFGSYKYTVVDVRGISDGKGGAIFAWHDQRFYDSTFSPGFSSVYAAKIDRDGNLTGIKEIGQDDKYNNKIFKLNQNYPNPFNPETKISFDIPETGKVKLQIFSITGQEINTLIDENRVAGSYTLIWNGKDNNNLKLSSGVYFYQLIFSNNKNQTKSVKKMIFAK